MAFLTKQETLIQWAELVSETQISKLNKIQNPQFASLILSKLDPEYFQPIILMHEEGVTLSLLFSQIINYYSKQIGTNISNMMDENINIFSSNSVELIWDLILGIAIKGRNRQKNINTILKMRPQAQQDLMRLISKVINRLGQNVSVIQNSGSQIMSQENNNISSNQTDIIMQLTQLNQQLKEKVEELNSQILVLKEKNSHIKLQLEEQHKQKKQITNILIKESVSLKSSISYSSGDSSSYPVVQYLKDIISQFHYLTKQLAKKQQKQIYYQDVNKDLKIAYNTLFNQLQTMHDQTSQKKVDIKKYERELEQLRAENEQLIEREKDLITKISDLQEQKFYLKDIVQRLQTKNSMTEQKIQKIMIESKKNFSNRSESEEQEKRQEQIQKQRQTHRKLLAMRQSDSFIGQFQQKRTDQQRQKTVRLQIDETKQPSLRNKLQRQVSHLQKKVNSVQQQNTSLKKINSILEKVISQFTKQSSQILQKYESDMQPIFKMFQQTLEEQKEKRKSVEQTTNSQKDEYELKIKDLLQKIKSKIEVYDSRQVQYQKIIKRLQIERDQLLKTVRVFEDQTLEVPKITVQKPKRTLTSNKIQLSIPSSKIQKDPNLEKIEKKQQNVKEQIEQHHIEETHKEEIYPQIKIENEKGEQIQLSQLLEEKKKTSGFLAASIINDDQQQHNGRLSRYSFMGNKQSTLQFGNEGQLGFKEKAQFNKLSYLGSYIREESMISEVNQQTPVESFAHVQIIDITQIEEQLFNIKQHYMAITNQSQTLMERILKKNKQKGADEVKNTGIEQIVKQYEGLGQERQNNKILEKQSEYLKQFEQVGLDRSKLTADNLKLKHQNNILKCHVSQLNKQRQAVSQKLTYLQELSSKNQQERTKQQLSKLESAINQIKSTMLQTQNNYNQMHHHVFEALTEGDKQIKTLTGQIEQLKQALQQREYAVAQLEMESSLLMGAVLQFRNNSIKIC